MLYLQTGSGLTLADTIKANGVNIDVGLNSNPDVVDWNQDARKDLVIGSESLGVRLYLNQGTDANPSFTTYTTIQSGGSQIYHFRANPRVFDIDQDGRKDLIIGDNAGYIHFYRNTGTNSNPSFSGSDTFRLTNGVPIDDYFGARPCCNDWNQDGRIDILTSGYDGNVTYYENIISPGVEETGLEMIANLAMTPSIVRENLTISYVLRQTARLSITVIAVDGRIVQTITDRNENPGLHQHRWSRRHLPSGFYFIRIEADGSSISKKIIVL